MKSRSNNYKFEIGIIVLIAICICYLMYFTRSKMNEIIISNEEQLLMVHSETNMDLHNEFAEKIISFRPGSYKMIEMYSEDLEQIFRIQFKEDDEYIGKDIRNESGLIDLLKEHEEGHTCIKINDMEEDIYFRWITDNQNNKCLVMIYMSKHQVKNIWVFTFVCCIILILIFILLIKIKLKQYEESVRIHRSLSSEIRYRIMS